MPSEIYMAQHMKSTDVNTILNIAAAGIEENRLRKNEWDQRGTGENAVTYEMAEVTAAPAETSDESETALYHGNRYLYLKERTQGHPQLQHQHDKEL